MKFKDGLYFEKAPSYCKNQHRMFIIDNGKMGSAGILHFDWDSKLTKKIKKYLGMNKKNIISKDQVCKILKGMN